MLSSDSWPFILAVRGRGFGAETEPTPAADAAAWSLVGLLVFCVVWIAITAILIQRRLRKQNPPKDLNTGDKTHAAPSERRPAWQKPEDWWKKENLK